MVVKTYTGKRLAIPIALKRLFRTIKTLTTAFKHRNFTIDGRLVGDIGEVLAEMDFDLRLFCKATGPWGDPAHRKGHDGLTSGGRRVDVKATFKRHFAFTNQPDYCLALKLSPSGSYEVIYNGPGRLIWKQQSHRKDIGKKQLSFSLKDLKTLSKGVPKGDKIAKRRSRVR
jgi:hypothetical protein